MAAYQAQSSLTTGRCLQILEVSDNPQYLPISGTHCTTLLKYLENKYHVEFRLKVSDLLINVVSAEICSAVAKWQA